MSVLGTSVLLGLSDAARAATLVSATEIEPGAWIVAITSDDPVAQAQFSLVGPQIDSFGGCVAPIVGEPLSRSCEDADKLGPLVSDVDSNTIGPGDLGIGRDDVLLAILLSENLDVALNVPGEPSVLGWVHGPIAEIGTTGVAEVLGLPAFRAASESPSEPGAALDSDVGFALDALPEPSSTVLSGGALLALAARGRRRARHPHSMRRV